jgi:hypothetical protein
MTFDVAGEGPEVSSFVEAVCSLYDDFDLQGFLAAHLSKLGQQEEIVAALDRLERDIDAIDDKLPDRTIVALPEWNRVVEDAHEARRLLQDVATSTPGPTP